MMPLGHAPQQQKGENAMPVIIKERVCAEIEGDIVIFLIGMRLNRFWKLWKWFPVLLAMPRMLQELAGHPELGLLHARPQFGLRNLWVIQYWRSLEHLHAYAKAADQAHLPAWKAFNASIGTSGDVGIWHETYLVSPGHLESVYVNMPRFGLGQAGTLYPAKGARASAAKRLAAGTPAPGQPVDPASL